MGARVAEIAAAIGQIAAEAERAEHDIAEVAAVAEQSSASAEQVSASTQQTGASTQEIAASAQHLAGTAEELDALVRRFKSLPRPRGRKYGASAGQIHGRRCPPPADAARIQVVRVWRPPPGSGGQGPPESVVFSGAGPDG